MLMEEAHHMYVGESGVGRIIQRTCEVMAEHKTDDPARLRELGVIDLPTVQRYLNFHCSVTIDLFGADVSSNAATFYSSGLKGRFEESRFRDDHLLKDAVYPVLQVIDGRLATRRGTGVECAQRKASRRLHQGYRRGRGALEPHHPKERDPLRVDRPA
jgi:benzoyl-CoA 2,3-dioxygenase component B